MEVDNQASSQPLIEPSGSNEPVLFFRRDTGSKCSRTSELAGHRDSAALAYEQRCGFM